MPKVKKTGIYRNEKGHAYKLVEGAVISDEIAAEYLHDEDRRELLRDGVADDGNGGEAPVDSDVVSEQDSDENEPDPIESTEIKLGGAPEDRMQPAPPENRSGKKNKSAPVISTDADLANDAADN